MSTASQPLTTRQKRQIRLILIGAAVAAAILWFAQPKVTDLGPLDFTLSGPNSLEFCDPRNPRFLAVANRPSAVILRQIRPGLFSLRTFRGKPVGDMNLVGRKLRLYAVDAELRRFAALDARPDKEEGQWLAEIPWGTTRVFADFIPAPTAREMYAMCPLPFGGQPLARTGADPTEAEAPPLTLAAEPAIYARHPVDVSLVSTGAITHAELAAFDERMTGPTGFLVRPPDQTVQVPGASQAHFEVTFPDPGRYVLWADADVNGRPGKVRLEIQVAP